jgi:recombinational DNA repair protein (RecF pathway)
MIKNKLYRMFAVVMALVVLLSSTGFGLVEHQCMVRGKTVQVVSLGEAHGCQMCAKKVVAEPQKQGLPVFKKKACCEENQRHEKVEVVSSVSQNAAKTLKAKEGPSEIPQLLSFLLHELELSQLDVPTPSFLSFSSRFYGRSMLSFVQSFLI